MFFRLLIISLCLVAPLPVIADTPTIEEKQGTQEAQQSQQPPESNSDKPLLKGEVAKTELSGNIDNAEVTNICWRVLCTKKHGRWYPFPHATEDSYGNRPLTTAEKQELKDFLSD